MTDEFVPISLLSFLRHKWLHVMAPLGFSLVAFFLSFLINFLLTQMLVPQAYGEATLVLAWLTILGSIITFGIDQTSLSFLSTLISEKANNSIHHFLAWGFKLLLKPFWVCLISTVITVLILLLPKKLGYQPLAILCLMGFIATPLLGLTNWLASILLAYKKTGHATFIQFLAFQLILAILLLVCLFFGAEHIRESTIFEIFLFTLVIMTLITIYFCFKFVPHLRTFFQKKLVEVDIKQEQIWFKSAYRQATSMLIYNLVLNLDFLLMGMFGKNTPSLGFYNLAIAISDIIWLVPQSLFQYLRPEIELALQSKSKTIILQKHWDQTLALNAILTLCLMLLIMTESHQILGLFSHDYQQTMPFLNVLVICNGLTALLGCPSIALRYSGHVNKLVLINFSAMILMICLSFIFVPLFGLIGIGYACTVTCVTQCLVENIIAKQFTQIKPLTWF